MAREKCERIPNMVGGTLVGGTRIGRKQVVVISITNHDGLFVGVAPNGQVFGKPKGKNKIEWDWNRMACLAEATIPAPHAVFGNLSEAVAAAYGVDDERQRTSPARRPPLGREGRL